MAVCAVCRKCFSRKGWPSTRQFYCSGNCRRKAYYRRHKERILAEMKEKNEGAGRQQRLAAQRKWNSSDRGKKLKLAWYQKNKALRFKEYLKLYHDDPYIKAVQRARAKSRKLLKGVEPSLECVICLNRGRISCHHVDDDPLNVDLSNLVWLCHPCHSLVHSEIPQGIRDQIEHSIQESLSRRQTSV